MPVNHPELRRPEISRPAVFAEWIGDFAPVDTGSTVISLIGEGGDAPDRNGLTAFGPPTKPEVQLNQR
jgi:hypothetical protein